MKKTVLGICMALAMLCNCCMAYATEMEPSNVESKVTNTNEMSVIDISLSYEYLNHDGKRSEECIDSQIMPGKEISMIPVITNEGADCYVRSKLSASVSKNGELTELQAPFGVDTLMGVSSDWKVIGDYIYYMKPLSHGESVDMFEGFMVDKEMGNEYADTSIDVNVVVEAVQENFFTPDFKQSSPWGDIETEECIRKGYDYASLRFSQDGNVSVHYDGGANKFVFVPDDFFSAFGAMEPGGIYTATANVSNESENEVELFFRTEVTEEKKLMEELQLDIIQVFSDKTEKLLYKGPLNSRDLQNYISLGVYQGKEHCDLKYTITVPEYLKNEYTLENGSVDWYFMADVHIPEKSDEPAPTENLPSPENKDPDKITGNIDPVNPSISGVTPYVNSGTGVTKGTTISGKTGDNANLIVPITLAILSGGLLVFLMKRESSEYWPSHSRDFSRELGEKGRSVSNDK